MSDLIDRVIEHDQAKLLANNLRRVDRLTRRGLLLFLGYERQKANTKRLRSKARLAAIRRSNTEVDVDLARIEWMEREP